MKAIDWLFQYFNNSLFRKTFLWIWKTVDILVMNEQWIRLIEYCSYRTNDKEVIAKNIGVEKLCQATDVNFGEKEQIENGWILVNDNREECLIVSFQNLVFINEIQIYESLNPGSIIKFEILESQRDKWFTMWQDKSHTNQKSLIPHIFKPILRRYRFQSNTIRITLDPRYTDRIGIQAIKLIGSEKFDDNLHRITLPQAMLNLYEQIFDTKNTDVQFLLDNQIINAHRNILCCRCLYFRALLLNDFTEKTQQKPIELTDIDYETFLELLFFIYTGTYHQTISYEIALKCMIYSNKINFLSGKNAAVEKLCHYLRLNHHLILANYDLLKQMSPAFDFLLDYIYELCSQYLNEICLQKEFGELEKDLMIDLIYQSSQRRVEKKKEFF